MAGGAANDKTQKFKRAVVLNGKGLVTPHIARDCRAALGQIGVI